MSLPVVAAVIGKEVVGETIEGGFRLAAAGITAAGTVAAGALSGAGSALGGALQGALTEGPKTIINNIGIAGTAGAQKVITGGGTLPAPKKVAKPAYNEKMPTEKLLNVAVKYLASIDSTLRTQIENDRIAFKRKVDAEKEAAIENKTGGESVFSKIGNKLGAMTETTSSFGERAGMVKKLLIGGGLIAGLGALGISKLNTTELDALKENVAAFKRDYAWMVDLAGVASGGLIGFLIKGMRGAIVGIAANWLYNRMRGGERVDENGVPLPPEGNSATDYAIGGGVAAYGAYQAYKGVKGIGAARTAALEIRTRPTYTTMAAKGAAKKGGDAWLSSRVGRRFMVFLGRKFGVAFMKRVAGLLVKVMAGVALTATGVGAIPGILWTLATVGLSLYTVYDLISAWWEFQEAEKANKEIERSTAVPVAGETPTGAAVLAAPSTGVKSKSETGRPEEAQAFFESKGWTKDQAAGIVGNLFVESGLRTDAVGDGGKAYGIAQWHPDRQATFQRVYGKDIKQSNFQEQLEFVNWELNNTEKRAGDALRGATSAADAAAIVDKKYERSSGAAIAQRQANATAISGGEYANLQGGGGSGGAAKSFDVGSALQSAKTIFGKAGGALIGAQNYVPRDINKDVNTKISNMSKQIETATIAGNVQEAAKAAPAAISATQKSVAQASKDGSLTALDPNYPGTEDTIMKYLAHWKFAA